MNTSLAFAFDAIEALLEDEQQEAAERARRRTFAAAGTIQPRVIDRRLARDQALERRYGTCRAPAVQTWDDEPEPEWSLVRTQPCDVGRSGE